MSGASDGFTVHETHGYLQGPGVEVRASSDGRGWTSAYASLQHQTPFEGAFPAVDAHFIVLHLDRLISVHRRVGNGEDSRIVAPGGLFMMPAGMEFGIRVDGSLHTLHLYLRRALLEEVASTVLVGDPSHIEILPRFGDSDPLIEHLMLGVRAALHEEDSSAKPYVDYLARAISAHLIRRHSAVTPAQRYRDAPARMADGQFTDAIDFMQANLERSIGLTAIAGATGLSPSHFARQFRLVMGIPPHQYLMQLRIERAKRLLRDTNTSVVDVALTCGFANQEHMTRLFKRNSGTTPAVYRKMLRT